MKKCPFCAEMIQDEAIKCRYCQSFLTDAPGSAVSADASPTPQSEPKAKSAGDGKAKPASDGKAKSAGDGKAKSAGNAKAKSKSGSNTEPAADADSTPQPKTSSTTDDDYWSDAAETVSPARGNSGSGVHRLPTADAPNSGDTSDADADADDDRDDLDDHDLDADDLNNDNLDDDTDDADDNEEAEDYISAHDKAYARDANASGSRLEKGVLYAGAPSWKAYLREYFYVITATVLAPIIGNWFAKWLNVSSLSRVLAVTVPIGLGVLAFLAITWYRNSHRIRVTTKNIETEYGFLSKKIDVLELWRCHDIRYRRTLWDRILRISHIDIYTADTDEPHLTLVGLPSSRQLLERIRDSIETQRERYGVSGP